VETRTGPNVHYKLDQSTTILLLTVIFV